jgi:hypothetical protein
MIEQENNTEINSNSISTTYGFIITRHVNSEKTNQYWNRCVKLIRTHYPYRLIVIIDDNSNPTYLKADHNYKNTIVIQSEYPGRGELLPYIYYSENKWFDRAVIIHDSVFFHKRIPFETINCDVMSLWHFFRIHNPTHYDPNIALVLKHGNIINEISKMRIWDGCFGVQSFIKHSFLVHIMKKYHIKNLIQVIKTRANRCSLERIFGIIFYSEMKMNIPSLFGNINTNDKFGYTYEEYLNDLKKGKVNANVIKVFSGR